MSKYSVSKTLGTSKIYANWETLNISSKREGIADQSPKCMDTENKQYIVQCSGYKAFIPSHRFLLQ